MRISAPERRDRALLVGAVSASILTILRAAGKTTGLDMMMKANTAKTRAHSLLNQRMFYFDWHDHHADDLAPSLPGDGPAREQ